MRILRITFIGILGVVVLAIALQSFLKLVPERKLHGKVKAEEEITFNTASILRGNLAKLAERYINNNVGFRSYMIPLDAQASFSIFNEIKNPKITLGLDNYLFEQPYLDVRNGFRTITNEQMEEQVKKMAVLRDTLKKNNIHFLFIISPSKASIYPEYIMQRHIYPDPQKTNYDLILPLLRKYEIPYVDSRKVLLELKVSEPGNKLYAKGGSHWNYYSSYAVMKQAIKLLEKNMSIKMHRNKLGYWNMFKDPPGADNDIANLSNVIAKKNFYDEMYNKPYVDRNTKLNGLQPRILLIASSFGEQLNDTLFNFGFTSHYMYFESYKKRYYSIIGDETKEVKLYGAMDTEKFEPLFSALNPEIVIMGNNEASLDKIGFGFMDDAMKILSK